MTKVAPEMIANAKAAKAADISQGSNVEAFYGGEYLFYKYPIRQIRNYIYAATHCFSRFLPVL